MKVKSLLAVTIATTVDIQASDYNGNKYHDFYVDYSLKQHRKNSLVDYCTSFVEIPKEIMDRDIKSVAVVRGELTIIC